MKRAGEFGMNDSQDQTLIDPEEAQALIPYVVYRWQLDEHEKNNILKAKRWMNSSRNLKKGYPSDHGLRLLHKKMFEDVWKWAGEYRKTEKNIGNVLSYQVHEELRKLCDDVKYLLQLERTNIIEIAAQFHHRLTCIHPFPNGNGRFAREASNILLIYNDQKPFSWGIDRVDQDRVRQDYIAALKQADIGNFSALLSFLKK